MVSITRKDDQDAANVLILTNHPLLGEALEDSLAGAAYLRVTQSANLTETLSRSGQRQPLILIVEEALLTDQLCDEIKAVGRDGRLQIIVFSSEHNEISICQTNQIALTGLGDFINIIAAFISQTPVQQQGDELMM
jgi:DNA-binding NarL/FixJ family response regulator